MTASILNDRFIYLFGGYNYPACLNTIEQYDIIERKTWDILDCKIQENLYRLSSTPISSTEILIFGGIDDEYKELI